MLNEASIVDHIPIWHMEDEFIVFKDGSLGAGFKLTGVDITSLTDESVNNISLNIENFLASLKEGYRIQFFYKLSNNVENTISTHAHLSDEKDVLYEPIKNSRLTFLNSAKNRGEFFKSEIFLFVRTNPQTFRKNKLFSKESLFQQSIKNQFELHQKNFDTDLNNIEASLHSYNLNPVRITKLEWVSEIYHYFNLERSTKLSPPTLMSNYPFSPSVANQLILSDVIVHKDQIQIGDFRYKTITIKTLPDFTHASMMDSFLKLAFPFHLSHVIEICDQRKEYDKLQSKRKITYSMAAGNRRIADLESESKLAQIESLLSELLETSEKIVNNSFTVIVWDKKHEGLEEKVQSVLRMIRNLNQSEGVIETYPCFQAFVKSFPGSCEPFRVKKVKSSNSSHLVPIYSSWEGNENGVCLIPNRDHVLVKIDPFDQKLPNWNGLVIGSSGSGKSFTLCQLVLMFYGIEPKPKIVWLDNGASSKNIVEFLDGEFLDVNLNSGICLNPFDIDQNSIEPPPSKIKLILAVLETICKDDEKKSLPKRDKALLEEAILDTYKSKRQPNFTDFRNILSKSSDLKKYADILFSWTGNSAFGRLLDGKTNIHLNKNLVTVEMKGLDVYPELQSVFLLLLTDYIQREAASDPNQKYLLIVDEAWKLFETNTGASFTIEAYRTFRKFKAGIWAISQNVNDFNVLPGIANAILQNTPSRIILKQRGVDWKRFSEILALNEAEINVIKSLRQEKGKYSEFYFIQDEARSVLRLTPDPLSYWLCTTDPLDKSKIEERRLQNPSKNFREIVVNLAEETK